MWSGVPTFGLDALGSAAYGPEAALTILIAAAAAGVRYLGPISLLVVGLLLVVFFSYRKTIAADPHGGGSHTVASDQHNGPGSLKVFQNPKRRESCNFHGSANIMGFIATFQCEIAYNHRTR